MPDDSLTPKDGELSASMHDFEAALTARSVTLELPPLDTILAVIDGSNQSAMVTGLAAAIAERSGAELHLAHVYPGPDDPARERFLAEQAERLGAGGVRARIVSRTPDERAPHEQITALAADLKADLLAVPAPYLEAFEELGSDSVGVTLDKLMTQSRPLLVVREPREEPGESLGPILLPITVHLQENPLAAAWALRIIGEGGTVRLVSVVGDEVLEAAADLLGEHDAGELDLDHLAGLDRPETAGLVAEMHRQAQRRGLGCRVSVRHGDLVAEVMALAEEGQRLIVTGCDTDPASSSYRRVQAIVRRAKDPVLVV